MDNNKKIFIGNIPYGITVEELKSAFGKFGNITDAYKPAEKGFAFVTFDTEDSAQAAIEGMNGQDLGGRKAVVNIAKPREDRPRRPFNQNRRSY